MFKKLLSASIVAVFAAVSGVAYAQQEPDPTPPPMPSLDQPTPGDAAPLADQKSSMPAKLPKAKAPRKMPKASGKHHAKAAHAGKRHASKHAKAHAPKHHMSKAAKGHAKPHSAKHRAKKAR